MDDESKKADTLGQPRNAKGQYMRISPASPARPAIPASEVPRTPGPMSKRDRDIQKEFLARIDGLPQLESPPRDPFVALVPIISAAHGEVAWRSIKQRLEGVKCDAKASFILVDDAKGSASDLLWATPIKYMMMGRFYGLVVMCIGGRVHDAREYNLLGPPQSEIDIREEVQRSLTGEPDIGNLRRQIDLLTKKRVQYQYMRETLKAKTNCKWLTVHDLFNDIIMAFGKQMRARVPPPKTPVNPSKRERLTAAAQEKRIAAANTRIAKANTILLQEDICDLLYFEGEFNEEVDGYIKKYTYKEVTKMPAKLAWTIDLKTRLQFVVEIALQLLEWHEHALKWHASGRKPVNVGPRKGLREVETEWYELTTDQMHKKKRTQFGQAITANIKGGYSSEARESGDRMTIAKLAVACVWGAGLPPGAAAAGGGGAAAAAAAAAGGGGGAAAAAAGPPHAASFYFNTNMFVHDIAPANAILPPDKFYATMEKWLISRLVYIGPADELPVRYCKGTGNVGEALAYRLFSLLTAFIAGDAQGVDLWQNLVSGKQSMTKKVGGVGHVDLTAAGLRLSPDSESGGNFKQKRRPGSLTALGKVGGVPTDTEPEEHGPATPTTVAAERTAQPLERRPVPPLRFGLSLDRIRLQF